MLLRLNTMINWSKMDLPRKSPSLSVRKGKDDESVILNIANQDIPTVSQEPVKSIGRWYDSTLKDTQRGKETQVVVVVKIPN